MAQKSLSFAFLALAVMVSYAIAASIERSSPEEVQQVKAVQACESECELKFLFF